MKRNSLADLVSAVGRIEVISTDVFDTLLLRTSRSERSRIMKGEQIFSSLLAHRGWHIESDFLANARFQAQRIAFRELAVRGSAGEVQLTEIIRRQLSLLGLPEFLVAERLRIEVQVEKASLVANKPLANILRAHKRAGARIVAVSDTTLPSEAVNELIQHFHGPDLVDHVYSSADHGLTKRDGDLFRAVARTENVSPDRMIHIGDDFIADVRAPVLSSADEAAPRRVPHDARPPHVCPRGSSRRLPTVGSIPLKSMRDGPLRSTTCQRPSQAS
jgi:FMN phosphatase YigB (HAD superfamily)